ncbi:MAG: hypothetical protein ACRDQH_00660, partial [Pseudonocardiaceae bacterium]
PAGGTWYPLRARASTGLTPSEQQTGPPLPAGTELVTGEVGLLGCHSQLPGCHDGSFHDHIGE